MAILTIDVGQKFVRYGFFDDEGNLTEKGKYQVTEGFRGKGLCRMAGTE